MRFVKQLHLNSELHLFHDKPAGFYAVICLQHCNRGPALGGCRLLDYSSLDSAIADAVRLSRAMRHKAAASGLPHNGGKAVIWSTRDTTNRADIWKRFGEYMDSLNGSYITTVDSGTTPADMALVKQHTPYVVGDSEENNPSAWTALGVFHGLRAVAQSVLDRELNGLHIVVQGTGQVGHHLMKQLAATGARLTVTDIDSDRAAHCARECDAEVIAPEAVYDTPCDIFAPCALGQVINAATVEKLQAKIIAGAANDQLEDDTLAERLHQRGLCYVPDFIINAGGLIYLSLQRAGHDGAFIETEIKRIGERVAMLSEQAACEGGTLLDRAMKLVMANIQK
jgi:leucine dehydrogenase